MEYYTYAYLREDRTPYYIGKGKGNRAYKRTRKELKSPKDKSRILILKQNLTEEEAFKHEIYMIAVFGRKDLGTGILYNRTNGGEGSSGALRSEELRKKISSSMKGRTFTKEHLDKISKKLKGRKVSEDHKKKNSEKLKGRKLSEETKKKMSESRIGRIVTEKTKQKIREKALGKAKNVKEYLLISPEGTEYIVNTGLKKFCNQQLISYSSIEWCLRNGNEKSKDGWSVKRND
jgi:hypothetical protein